MKYARITKDGNLEYAPKNKDDIINWLNTEEKANKHGFYEVSTIEIPTGYVLNGYKIENNKIVADIKQIEEKDLSYIEKRKAEYPSIETQLDMIYWDKVYDTNIWQETISAIKTKYPKPE